ncbi:hypothetical protein G6F60_015204 [Rhizopus arrhizus]|nr:hypothetical protein G6F60_015204 [Rhizopus arrhizus]
MRIALTGGAMAFVLAEAIGLAAACFPEAWLRLFGAEHAALQQDGQRGRTAGQRQQPAHFIRRHGKAQPVDGPPPTHTPSICAMTGCGHWATARSAGARMSR